MEYGLVVVWWLAYVGLGLFGLPVAARLCSSLPGRGAGFSLALSCTVMTLVAFWVGYLALGWVALLAGLAGVKARRRVSLACPQWWVSHTSPSIVADRRSSTGFEWSTLSISLPTNVAPNSWMNTTLSIFTSARQNAVATALFPRFLPFEVSQSRFRPVT